MQWSQPSGWLDLNGEPDYVKLARAGIRGVYIDPRAANAKRLTHDLPSHGVWAGIYAAANWPVADSPEAFAQWVSDQVGWLIPQAYPLPSQPWGAPVMLDLEGVPYDWIGACVTRYRQQGLRPVRETAFTTEPFQDGTVVPIPLLRAAGLHWYAQLYYGDMSPADPAAVLLELARWGYPPNMLHPFYNAARLPADSRDGCVFTLGRLP